MKKINLQENNYIITVIGRLYVLKIIISISDMW